MTLKEYKTLTTSLDLQSKPGMKSETEIKLIHTSSYCVQFSLWAGHRLRIAQWASCILWSFCVQKMKILTLTAGSECAAVRSQWPALVEHQLQFSDRYQNGVKLRQTSTARREGMLGNILAGVVWCVQNILSSGKWKHCDNMCSQMGKMKARRKQQAKAKPRCQTTLSTVLKASSESVASLWIAHVIWHNNHWELT